MRKQACGKKKTPGPFFLFFGAPTATAIVASCPVRWNAIEDSFGLSSERCSVFFFEG